MSTHEEALKAWLLSSVVREKSKGKSRYSSVVPVSNEKCHLRWPLLNVTST